MKLDKGQRVVITCNDTRKSFEPTVATVVTCGRKWVTVKLNGIDFPYYFKNEYINEENGNLEGGCKDGSYQIYRLWNYHSVEEYNYQMEMRKKKFDLVTEINTKLELNKYDLPIDYLLNLKEELENYFNN